MFTWKFPRLLQSSSVRVNTPGSSFYKKLPQSSDNEKVLHWRSIIFETKHFSKFWGHAHDLSPAQNIPLKKDDALTSPGTLFAYQVFISTRGGSWIISRISKDGYPWDMIFHTRYKSMLQDVLPRIVLKWMRNQQMDRWFSHENYALEPQNK